MEWAKKKPIYANTIKIQQTFSHPNTNQARPCLASEIRRDRACSGWYGRRQSITNLKSLYKIYNITYNIYYNVIYIGIIYPYYISLSKFFWFCFSEETYYLIYAADLKTMFLDFIHTLFAISYSHPKLINC